MRDALPTPKAARLAVIAAEAALAEAVEIFGPFSLAAEFAAADLDATLTVWTRVDARTAVAA